MRKQTHTGRNQDIWKKRLAQLVLAMIILLLAESSTISQVSGGARSPEFVMTQQGGVQTPAAEKSGAQQYFTDVELVNQHGEKVRFYTDLLKGKVVILSSFFSTCPGSCLPMIRNLEKIQQALGDRLGKDVRMISISVDPTADTPFVLKEYAKRVNAGPGWYFLTGAKQDVEFVLKKIGLFVENKKTHLTALMIGNDSTGLWKKAAGTANSEELIKVVESVVNDKLPAKNEP